MLSTQFFDPTLRIRRYLRLLCLALFPGLLLSITTIQPVVAATPSGFVDDLIANVVRPTALAFTPDGRLLISQQTGALRVYQNDVLLSQVALNLAAVICSNSERGLLGIAVDPNFATNHYIYLYYTFDQAGTKNCPRSDPVSDTPVNRVSRFTLPASNVIDPASEVVILSNIQSNWGNHNGGDMHFGADGYLYISAGDGGHESMPAQNAANLNGKIIRILISGNGSYSYAGNPYATSAGVRKCGNPAGFPGGTGPCGEVFAKGLRNPFRFAFKPGTNQFYINDVGQGVTEEINAGSAGADYGWNQREGLCSYPGQVCGNIPNGLTDPLYYYNHDAGCASITGGAFIPAGIWPAEYGGYLFSDYVCGKIFRLTPNAPYSASDFITDLGVNSAVTLIFGPYNSTQALYTTNYNNGGQVHRISYTGVTNQAPTARISANPTSGSAPLLVNFSGASSSDPEGSSLRYDWDFGDGQSSNNNTSATIQHSYATIGTYTAKLVVQDNSGNRSSPASVRIDAGNTAPIPVINSPSAGARFFVGQVINLQGSASDAQDGTLGAGALSWEVLQVHTDSRNPQNVHSHPYLAPTSGTNIALTAPDMEDLYAYDSYLEIRLTATDANGLSATTTRQFFANGGSHDLTATFRTQPAGLSLMVNGINVASQQSFYVWQGSQLQVNAASPQSLNGTYYQYASWSDGKARSHTIVMPGTNTTYTANFSLVAAPTSTQTPVPTATKTPMPTTTSASVSTSTKTPTVTETRTPQPSQTPTQTATITPGTATPTSTPNIANCPVTVTTQKIHIAPNAPVLSSVTLSGMPKIADVNVQISLTHSYVGDLSITLTHQPSGRKVTLLDRPLQPPLSYGCRYDNIAAIFSDEASIYAEDTCEPVRPTINGSYRPNEALSRFDNMSANGTWTLEVIDNDPRYDVGIFYEWQLQICKNGAQPSDMTLPDNIIPLIQGRDAPEPETKEEEVTNQTFLPLITR